MEPIIPPVDRELLRAELTPERKARDTKKAGNEIYIFPASECPALMREIGRLREIAFRGAGGGTGREVDIDAEDLAEDGYYQLIVWDPAAGEIVGGYRFIICTDEYPRHLSTEHYFVSATSFVAGTCPAPSSWDARSCSPPTRRAATPRASMRWITFGTASGR